MRETETTVKTTYTCDRCGRVSERNGDRWARIAVQVDGVADEETFPIGVGLKDLCPDCILLFHDWWEVKK